jgi:uncharacterized membrane protein SpoIIM required for sporulation
MIDRQEGRFKAYGGLDLYYQHWQPKNEVQAIVAIVHGLGGHSDNYDNLVRYLWGFPQVVRDSWVYLAIATAIFFLAAIIAWWYAWQDPAFMSLVVPEQLIEKVRDKGELWMGSILGIEPVAASGIMTNNISVSFRVVGGGITAGIYTVFMLAFNGLLMGAIAALVGQNNLAYPFWAFVFPHGSLELPAIFFAGGAGLLIAKAILFPGRYLRIDALKINGLQAAQLVFGIVPMLVIAGAIEGFFSPSPIVPEPVKYMVGMVLFWLLFIYCGRNRDNNQQQITKTSQ